MKTIEEFLQYRFNCQLCGKKTSQVWHVGDISVKHEINDHMITLFDLTIGNGITIKRGSRVVSSPTPNPGFENCELHIDSKTNKFITYNPTSSLKILYYPPIGCKLTCDSCKAYSFTFGSISVVHEYYTEFQPFKYQEIFNYKNGDDFYSVIINYMEETTSLFKVQEMNIDKFFGILQIEVPTIMQPYKNVSKTIDRLKKLQTIK